MLTAAHSLAAEHAPFVAGFERFHRPSASEDGGMLLLTELSCTACHKSNEPTLQPRTGPDLSSAGLRIQASWLRKFLTDPAETDPGTAMPNVLHQLEEQERPSAIDALTAFLSTQRKPFPKMESTGGNPVAVEFWRKGDSGRGQKLFHQTGCIACHAPDPDYPVSEGTSSDFDRMIAQLTPDELKELGLTEQARPVPSVPLGDITGKLTRRSLTHFLFNPEIVRPHSRMPKFGLSLEESSDLTAWLFRQQSDLRQSLAPSTDADLIERGKHLFSELRCTSCHTIGETLPQQSAKVLTELSVDARVSCIDRPSRSMPSFRIDDIQRVAIQKALKSVKDVVKPTASNQLAFHMTQMNCFACHSRDGKGGVGPKRRPYLETDAHVDIGDEGRIPPSLDGAGRKLQTAWITQVLQGKGSIRPHLTARMPIFPATLTKPLPALFASAEDAPTQSAEDVFGKQTDVKAGRELLNIGCVQCHSLKDEVLAGVVGVDIGNIDKRIRPQWFHDFLLNPVALKQRTRMPTFFPNGRSSNQQLLGGDTEQQIAAMWYYLTDIQNQPLPEKIEKGKLHNFELTPGDKPLVLRTFMKDAGPHAIAVGYPQKSNVAFDAETVRLAQIWQGRFLDAHGTWFDRFVPPAEPLGTKVITFTNEPEFLSSLQPDAPSRTFRFKGYRLTKSGDPVFLYEMNDVSIEDEFRAVEQGLLERVITLKTQSADQHVIWFRSLHGSELERLTEHSYRNEQKLTVNVDGKSIGQSVVQQAANNLQSWMVPVEMNSKAVLTVTYQW